MVDIFNETQSDFEPLICNHNKADDTQNQIEFIISNPEHYTVIITTVVVSIYENRGNISLILNDATLQSKFFQMSVSRDYGGGGRIPITFIHTIPPNSLPLTNILKVTGFNSCFSDILILHGPSI